MIDRPIWLLVDSRSVGGIETHIGALAEGLLAAGQRPEVVLWQDYGGHPLAGRLAAAGVPLRHLGGRFPTLLRGLRTARPVLHTHGYKAGIVGRIAARLAGTPVVSTFHAGEPGSGKLRLYLMLDRATARLGRSIAVSPAIARSLPGPAELIPNFVTVPDEPLPAARPATVAFVGRLSEEKGPDLFAQLAAAVPGVTFLAFGDGPMRGALDGAPVTWRGMVPDMGPHWGEIGLLCMPSRHEGLPLAALEAMARGIPVAAFAVGALPEVIQDGVNGWLAAPQDLTGLQAAVRRWAALDDAARCRIGEAARAAVRERYDRDAAVRRILMVYEAAEA